MGKKKNNLVDANKIIEHIVKNCIEQPDSAYIIYFAIATMINESQIIDRKEAFFKVVYLGLEEAYHQTDFETLSKKFNYVIGDYYEKNRLRLPLYSRNYDKVVADILKSPEIGKCEDSGIWIHKSSAPAFREVISELKEEQRPYNKYAAIGCINTLRSVLEFEDAEFKEYENYGIYDLMEDERKDAFSYLGSIIDYFFDSYTFIKKRKYRKEIMQEIKRLCDESQQSRDFFLGYYESRPELFDELFSEYPEYIFITQGKYKRYKVVMDLAEKLEITMQDKPEIEVFFADRPESNHKDDEPDEKAAIIRGRYAFSMEEHQIKLIHALDSFTQRLLGEGQDYQIYNFWPNDTLDRRVVKPVGPYIAVAFKRHDKWYMLIDGIYERCAIYIWTGENLIDGLSIFKTNKGYARQQQNVCHLNHRGTREAYEVTYLKALSKIS